MAYEIDYLASSRINFFFRGTSDRLSPDSKDLQLCGKHPDENPRPAVPNLFVSQDPIRSVSRFQGRLPWKLIWTIAHLLFDKLFFLWYENKYTFKVNTHVFQLRSAENSRSDVDSDVDIGAQNRLEIICLVSSGLGKYLEVFADCKSWGPSRNFVQLSIDGTKRINILSYQCP